VSRVVVTGHQVNFLPGCSVLAKVAEADHVIWMDAFQYERHGFVNRNRLEWPDGSWMTVPVNEADTFQPINQVRIADNTGRIREKIARGLVMKLGALAEPYAAELRKPYKMLVALNWQLLQLLIGQLGITTAHHFQSHLEAGEAHKVVPIVADYEPALLPARERLAAMVAEIGGNVWLSGPSGATYLDEKPFHDLGIAVEYFDWNGLPNPSAITMLKAT